MKLPQVIFPPAWQWNGTVYEAADLLRTRRAYWVYRLGDGAVVTIQGVVALTPTDHFGLGWHLAGMVGGPPYADAVMPITSTPAGAVDQLSFYCYDTTEGQYKQLLGNIPCGVGVWMFVQFAANVHLGQP